MEWKIIQRFFVAVGAAGAVILVFSAFLAIWDLFDISTYWRSLASIFVLVFTSLVCAGTAQLLEKYEMPKLAPSTGGELDTSQQKSSLMGTLRNAAGMLIIGIFFLHGIYGFFAVWNSYDDIFPRVVLSGFTFILGLLVLTAITGVMEYGRKRAERIYTGLYPLIVILFIIILIGIRFL